MEPVRRDKDGRSGTVLLVEDSDVVRDVVANMLESGGLTVLQASGGEEALALVRRGDDADGGNQRQMGDVVTDLIAPTWSPSGGAVVVVGKVGNNLSDLFMVRTDGTLARRLTWGGWFTGALYVWINWLLRFIAFTGPLYAWIKWPSERRNLELPAWRRVTLSVGLFTVTIQAILYLALLAPRSAVYHHDVLYDVEQRAVLFSIILVLPAFACILTWKGPARLLLLGAELSLPILCFGRAMDLFGAW